jgi:hypothetical protein
VAPLKASLKRGVLVTAANWQVVLIQFIADALFKTLLAVPVIGGMFLVVLLAGGEPSDLLDLPARSIIPTMTAVLLEQPLALGAFLFALAVIVIGGSALMFLVKGGTVTVLVTAERATGPIEHPPLRLPAFKRAGHFSIERFVEGSRRLFRRYLLLGTGLLIVYGVTTAAALALALGPAAHGSWGETAGLSLGIVAWITVVNLVYLLLQVIVAADDCQVSEAVARLGRLLRVEFRSVALIFGATLILVVLTTAASILATAALTFIGFVPLIGIAVVPILQLIAWIVRGVVFEFIGLTALVAYLRVYRIAQGLPSRAIRSVERTA